MRSRVKRPKKGSKLCKQGGWGQVSGDGKSGRSREKHLHLVYGELKTSEIQMMEVGNTCYRRERYWGLKIARVVEVGTNC